MLTTLQRIPRRKLQISVAEREVQAQMEDGLGEVQSRYVLMPVKLYGILEWRFQLLFRLQQDRLLQRKGIRTATDHHRNDWNVRLESHPMRFLTARQERTEVVTRAGLVFSMRRSLFLYPRTAGAACCAAIR